jgi:hypothetical protein
MESGPYASKRAARFVRENFLPAPNHVRIAALRRQRATFDGGAKPPPTIARNSATLLSDRANGTPPGWRAKSHFHVDTSEPDRVKYVKINTLQTVMPR